MDLFTSPVYIDIHLCVPLALSVKRKGEVAIDHHKSDILQKTDSDCIILEMLYDMHAWVYYHHCLKVPLAQRQ